MRVVAIGMCVFVCVVFSGLRSSHTYLAYPFRYYNYINSQTEEAETEEAETEDVETEDTEAEDAEAEDAEAEDAEAEDAEAGDVDYCECFVRRARLHSVGII